MIGAAIYARLAAVSAVTNLVSTRIYPGVAKEGAVYPLILYSQISAGPEQVLANGVTHFRTLQQIDIYAATIASATAIAAAVRGALDYKINQTWGSLSIPASMFDDQFDTGFESDQNLHRIIQQYRIVYAA